MVLGMTLHTSTHQQPRVLLREKGLARSDILTSTSHGLKSRFLEQQTLHQNESRRQIDKYIGNLNIIDTERHAE